jgi:hypothetical protein
MTLAMSQRALSRRLADKKRTYECIPEEMRQDLGLHDLRDRSLTISRTAWLLGSQETAAFSIAFRR